MEILGKTWTLDWIGTHRINTDLTVVLWVSETLKHMYVSDRNPWGKYDTVSDGNERRVTGTTGRGSREQRRYCLMSLSESESRTEIETLEDG